MGKGGGISDRTQAAEVNIAQQQTDIAKQQQQNAQREFNASYPGFQTAENYYQTLASGDPSAIARSIAPATQQINAQAEANKQRINQDTARGGAKNLALAENEINKGAQIGNASTQSFLQAFQSLAGLAGQGIGQSNQATGLATGALSAAGNQYSQIANQQAEGKAAQLGFFSSLAGSGAELAGGLCWIAEVLYGGAAIETYMLRYYVNEIMPLTRRGRAFCRLYMRYGERVALRMQKGGIRSGVLYVIFAPVFDRLLNRARREIPGEVQADLWDKCRKMKPWRTQHA
jgi:hypothetical protein